MHLAFCGHFVASKCILVRLQIAFDADLFARRVAPLSAPPPPPPPAAAATARDPHWHWHWLCGTRRQLWIWHWLHLRFNLCECVCMSGAIDCDGSNDHFLGPLCGCQPQMQSEISYRHPASTSTSVGIYLPNYLA